MLVSVPVYIHYSHFRLVETYSVNTSNVECFPICFLYQSFADIKFAKDENEYALNLERFCRLCGFLRIPLLAC